MKKRRLRRGDCHNCAYDPRNTGKTVRHIADLCSHPVWNDKEHPLAVQFWSEPLVPCVAWKRAEK